MIYYYYKNISEIFDEQCEKMRQEIAFHFSERASMKRKDSICAKYMLCNMLESLFGISEYFISPDENGKLFIDKSDIFFSISHSKDMIFCAVGTKQIGCDVQEITKSNGKVAKRFFTEKENELLFRAENEDEAFFKLWTIKESILKYHGSGISGGLSTYDFSDCCDKEKFNKHGLNFTTFKKDKYAFSVCSTDAESCLYE